MMDWNKLKEPFAPGDIEWRIQQSGFKEGKGPWAKVVAYVTSRAIQDRLDDVCGPAGWQTDLRTDAAGVICGIGIKCGDEWIWKWDGAPYSDIEGYKGGISGAVKRAAVQHGIGRYLYGLKVGWATFVDKHKGMYQSEIKGHGWHDWNPPDLPAWALPGGGPPVPDEPKKGTYVPESGTTDFTGANYIIAELNQCKTVADVAAVSKKFSTSIKQLPAKDKKRVVDLGKKLKAELQEAA